MAKKIIAMVNQKGGVAKTTTTANLAWGLADAGKRVLAIDFDPQGNLSTLMGAQINHDKHGINETPTAFEWLLSHKIDGKAIPFADVVQHCDGVDLIPTEVNLAQAEMLLQGQIARERFLTNAINEIPKTYDYDYILIDSPPSLGLLTINILTAATDVLVPLKPEFLCYQGASILMNTIADIKRECNSKIKLTGFLITMIDTRRNSDDVLDLIQNLAESAGSKVYNSKIRYNAATADVSSYSTSIYKFKPNSIGAQDYAAFVKEFLASEVK